MTEEKPALTRQQISDHLRDHPEVLSELLEEHPALLDALSRRELQGDEVLVDFQQQRISSLSNALDKRSDVHEELIDTSRSNLQTQLQVNETIIEMIGCRDLESLIGYISRDMSQTLRLDAVILCVESRDQRFPFIREPVMSVKQGGLTAVFSDGSTIILGQPSTQSRTLFGPAADLVQSQALIRLDVEGAPTPIALVMGDRNADYFHRGQATHLLRFLGDVLATLLGHFMADGRADRIANGVLKEDAADETDQNVQWLSPEKP